MGARVAPLSLVFGLTIRARARPKFLPTGEDTSTWPAASPYPLSS
jgi:hypothetical protein